VVPTINCLYLSPSHDLSLIVILNCPVVSSLKIFKGNQLSVGVESCFEKREDRCVSGVVFRLLSW
jgi:hypothetical protein